MARLQEKLSHFGSNGQSATYRTDSSSPLCDRSNNDYHQQYLDKNPGGYCGIGRNGMTCPVGVAKNI